jgi:general secretion pathway protein E
MNQIESESIVDRFFKAIRQWVPDSIPETPQETPSDLTAAVRLIRIAGISSEIERRSLGVALNLDVADSLKTGFQFWPEFIQQVPISLCREHHVIGLRRLDGRSILCMASADAWQLLDVVRRWMKCPVDPVLASEAEIKSAIDHSYEQRTDQTGLLLQTLPDGTVTEHITGLTDREDLLDSGDRAPVIQLVNSLLFEAVRNQASDIHIQPRENYVSVRMRIDGILFDVNSLPRHIQEEVVTRVKVLGRMNIAEKRLPQDGRATVQVGQRTIDLRIASMPTSHGERVVIRLLDKSARLYTLEELGMDSSTLCRFRSSIRQEHGLVLVTGPTGSGKSTTLYASLQELDTTERNAVTLEDPIEYELEGISQTQINTRKGMTFASGLRSVLRQDPDIIMLGEIRDQETAVMAIQSSLTGHMVFSTLHTNDAPSAVTRLLDLGIEPFLASSSLLAILAQRLVRRICPECRVEFAPSEPEKSSIGVPQEVEAVFRGRGCERCRGTGYRGRFGVFELLTISSRVQQLITRHATAAEIRQVAIEEGMRPMRQDGIEKVIMGQTTIEEVARVTVDSL